MTTNSTWAALRNPAFRKLWIAAVISGTCVAAQDSAATWTMNIFTGSPLLLSLMSTVASLPFFLFTLPAGALADKVDRRKLVCTVHQENGALTGPLIFTLPASSFIVVLGLNWLDGTVQLFPRKTPRSELSGNSEENDEGLRGRWLERNAGSCKTLPKR